LKSKKQEGEEEMKKQTRRVGERQVLVYINDPVRSKDGEVVLYRTLNTEPNGSDRGVIKIDDKWFSCGYVYEPAVSCLAEAVCRAPCRWDLVGIAWGLSNFNLTLNDCMQDDPIKTRAFVLKQKEEMLGGRIGDGEQTKVVEEMANSVRETYPDLYKEIMMVVEHEHSHVQS
jgi:hypothetical protein